MNLSDLHLFTVNGKTIWRGYNVMLTPEKGKIQEENNFPLGSKHTVMAKWLPYYCTRLVQLSLSPGLCAEVCSHSLWPKPWTTPILAFDCPGINSQMKFGTSFLHASLPRKLNTILGESLQLLNSKPLSGGSSMRPFPGRTELRDSAASQGLLPLFKE